MTSRWHLVTGEYPPDSGGIADFTSVMARALADAGTEVHVWSPNAAAARGRVNVHCLPDVFGRAARTALVAGHAAMPGRVVLHYTPNALGHRGANLGFCRWFAARARDGWDTRVFFHEPFLCFGRQSLRRNALAAAHRVMATFLLSSADEVYLSTPSWQPLLERYARGTRRWTWVPVTPGAFCAPDAQETARARTRICPGADFLVGTFGTYAPECVDVIRRAIAATLAACPDAHVVCMGRNSRAFAESLPPHPRLSSTGDLRDSELGPAIASCDLMLQAYPEGVTFRRTSLLRCLSFGAAVVTTNGRRTEPLWASSGAVALASADAPDDIARECRRLLHERDARRSLIAAARATYDRVFSPDAMLRALDAIDVTTAAS